MHNHDSPSTELLRRWPGYLAALGAGWLAVGGLAGVTAGTALSAPFGWQRLAVVHLLLMLPLCAAVAWFFHAKSAGLRRRWWWKVWSLIGIAGAGLVAQALPDVAAALDGNDAGFAVRALVRVIVCILVELPWCLAIEAYISSAASPQVLHQRSSTETTSRACVWGIVLAAVAATALPVAYACDLCRRQSIQTVELLEQPRLVAAERVVARLIAVGSPRLLGDATATVTQRRLEKTIDSLTQRVVTLKAAGAEDSMRLDAAQRIELARALAMLDRVDEARQWLTPVADTQAEAALLLAAMLQQQCSWEESSRWYRHSAQLAEAMKPSPEAVAHRIRAINGLAFNARELGRYADAEMAYRQGLAELPAAAAHFHFQLGRHYQLGGRPLDAIDHLQQATSLDPRSYGAQAGAILKRLANESPGCMLGAGWGAPHVKLPAASR